MQQPWCTSINLSMTEGDARASSLSRTQSHSINSKLATRYSISYLLLRRLELRRIYADLIYIFKLIHNNISSSLINVFKFNNQVHCRETRGHRYKLFFNRGNKLVFSKVFTNRIVPIWNHLPGSCFDSDTLFYLKNQLHNTDFSRFLYGH